MINNTKIFCCPALIKKCKGIIIENVDNDDLYDIKVKEVIDKAKSNGYYIYHLQHHEEDWTRLATISCKPNKDNKLGWFLSKQIIDFATTKRTDGTIWLTSRNTSFYKVNEANTKVEKIKKFETDTNLDPFKYLDGWSEVIWMMIDNL